MKKEHLVLILIVIFAAFLRFFKLGVVPAGVTHDELGYIYNAYSIAKTGNNIFGEFLPFITWMHGQGWPFLPVPVYLSAPWFLLFDLSATTGRLPSAILGVVDILLIYIIVRQIFNKISLALLSAFFLTISPWHLHFTRSAYDANFALFFYLLGIVVFIFEIKKRNLPILSSVFFLMAIFSYRGMNLIFPALVIILFFYGLIILKMTRKQLLAFFIGTMIIVLSLFTASLMNGPRYTTEALSLINDPKMQEYIDREIREAQGPLFIRRLFINKPTYIIGKLRENYIKAYSPDFLFLYTEPSKIYSIWSRGRIYFFDLFLIILGLAYLFKINKKGASFIIGLVLVGGLPGMVNGMPYSSRNFLMAAFLPVVIGAGVLFLLNNSWLKKLKLAIVFILILSYGYVFTGYLFDYYGRYALYGAESWAKSLKDLSFTIDQKKSEYQNVIVVGSLVDFMQYAFYSKQDPSFVQTAWQRKTKNLLHDLHDQEVLVIRNVAFMGGCLGNSQGNLPDFEKTTTLYITPENCHKNATASARLTDYHGNTIWKMYNFR